MSQDFQIISWDGIISTNRLPLASITFKPNKAFIEQFLQNTNNRLQIRITGTNSKYDNVWMALIDTSANVPNCRKNFYDATQYWIATLLGSTWQGQPSALGQMSIVNGPYQVYQQFFKNLNNSSSSECKPTKCKPDNSANGNGCLILDENKDKCNNYVWIFIALIILAFILYFVYNKNK